MAPEVSALEERVRELENRVEELTATLADYEDRWERVRDAFGDLKDALIPIYELLDLELVPRDIQALVVENERLKAELERYREEERLRRDVAKRIVESEAVRAWLQQVKREIDRLIGRSRASEVVLGFMVSTDPGVPLSPAEFRRRFKVGHSDSTVKTYMRHWAAFGIRAEEPGPDRVPRFRNDLKGFTARAVRAIYPEAPDEAIDAIADELKGWILKRCRMVRA